MGSSELSLRMREPLIAVVGAGLGGLVLACVLQKHGREVVVFEKDTSSASRGQGGVLDLHVESGQWALITAGLASEFRAMARAEGQDTRILDAHGRVLFDEVSSPDAMDRPEVDRPALRDLLVKSLRPGTIQWGHALSSLEASEDGRRLLRFANGRSVSANLVIGADGALSRVRPSVTRLLPAYSGVSFIDIAITDVARRHPEVCATVGRGTLFAFGDNKGFIAQRNGDGRIRTYVLLRMPEDGFGELGIHFDVPRDTREGILALFAGWAPELRRLVEACDDTFLPRPIKAMPVGVSWPHCPGITLLGDAAHQMSFFAGAGANLAMQDGAKLALELIGTPDLSTAVAAYEAAMFSRIQADAQASAEGLEMCLSLDGAARLAGFMEQQKPASAA